MKSFSLIAGVAGLSVLLLAGCGTAPRRLDPTADQGVVSVNKINFGDYQIAAEKSINSLLESGAILRPDNRKSVVMVSEVKNNTQSRTLNTQILTDKIRQALLRSGKAVATSAVGSGRDQAVADARKLEDSELFDQSTVQKTGSVIAPDFSLSGQITQEYTKEGRTEESYFFIHLVLTDLSNGLVVWEENTEVLKQGKKSIF